MKLASKVILDPKARKVRSVFQGLVESRVLEAIQVLLDPEVMLANPEASVFLVTLALRVLKAAVVFLDRSVSWAAKAKRASPDVWASMDLEVIVVSKDPGA